jgi:hypothetical protein
MHGMEERSMAFAKVKIRGARTPEAPEIVLGLFVTSFNPSREAFTMQFAVGLRLNDKSGHVVVDAEDALIAALKVKQDKPAASITYVRRQNKRGDARHPPHHIR